MKIAYLLLCHKNKDQIEMLIDSLYTKESHFFIHMDKKATGINFERKNNIFVLDEEKRIDVQWGTISMVHATLNLIEAVINSNIKFDYVCLLSGQDYPIKTLKYINDFFNIDLSMNYIEIIDHNTEIYKRYLKRSHLYYPRIFQNCNLYSRVVRKLYIYISGGYKKTYKVFLRKKKYIFEFGSQWWCLTFECIKWMYDFLNKNGEYIKFFENSMTPDECFFQTLFFMSPYCCNQSDKIMFFEWSENQNNPRIFVKKDYELLRKQNYLFARKFDILVDEKIIKLLGQGEDNYDIDSIRYK